LSRNTSLDDLRKAHRKLVRKYHPDASPEDPEPRSASRKSNRPTKSCLTRTSGGSTIRGFVRHLEEGLGGHAQELVAGPEERLLIP
jgi:DnaJ domain